MQRENPKKFREEIYMSFSQLQKEVERRWNNKELRKKIEDFFGSNIDILKAIVDRPRAMISRSIGTPNLEMRYFLDLAKEIKLDPIILEYNDKFVSKNKDKYHLGRLFFYETPKNHSPLLVDNAMIVNFNKYEGKRFSEIKTVEGESFVGFHHDMLEKELPELKGKTFDFSEWFNKARQLSPHYYFYYLALFVCHGVLFENFLIGDKQEESFIAEKFLPSFREVERVFGVKPLIYPLLPFENEKNPTWLSYSASLRKKIGMKARKKRSKLANYTRYYWHLLSHLFKTYVTSRHPARRA